MSHVIRLIVMGIRDACGLAWVDCTPNVTCNTIPGLHPPGLADLACVFLSCVHCACSKGSVGYCQDGWAICISLF